MKLLIVVALLFIIACQSTANKQFDKSRIAEERDRHEQQAVNALSKSMEFEINAKVARNKGLDSLADDALFQSQQWKHKSDSLGKIADSLKALYNSIR